jgi:hypothetical protein
MGLNDWPKFTLEAMSDVWIFGSLIKNSLLILFAILSRIGRICRTLEIWMLFEAGALAFVLGFFCRFLFFFGEARFDV